MTIHISKLILSWRAVSKNLSLERRTLCVLNSEEQKSSHTWIITRLRTTFYVACAARNYTSIKLLQL